MSLSAQLYILRGLFRRVLQCSLRLRTMVRFRLKNVVSLFLVCITLILIISQNPRYWKPCSEQSLNLSGRMHLEIHTMSAPSFATIRKLHSISTYANGHNEPTTCKSALHNLAIIVPLREREKQFRMLLNHLYGILSRQQVAFTIYALTQSSKGIFNRAKLFNVGIHEALKGMDNRPRHMIWYDFRIGQVAFSQGCNSQLIPVPPNAFQLVIIVVWGMTRPRRPLQKMYITENGHYRKRA